MDGQLLSFYVGLTSPWAYPRTASCSTCVLNYYDPSVCSSLYSYSFHCCYTLHPCPHSRYHASLTLLINHLVVNQMSQELQLIVTPMPSKIESWSYIPNFWTQPGIWSRLYMTPCQKITSIFISYLPLTAAGFIYSTTRYGSAEEHFASVCRIVSWEASILRLSAPYLITFLENSLHKPIISYFSLVGNYNQQQSFRNNKKL